MTTIAEHANEFDQTMISAIADPGVTAGVAVHIARKGTEAIRKIAVAFRRDADDLDDHGLARQARFLRHVAAQHDTLAAAIDGAAMEAENRTVEILTTLQEA